MLVQTNRSSTMAGIALLASAVIAFFGVPALGNGAFSWSRCSSNAATEAIEVLDIKASPIPLHYPGPLHLSITANVKKTIHQGAMFHLTIEKVLLGMKTKVPCVSGIGGSCSSDLCSVLNSALQSSDADIRNLVGQVDTMFKQAGADVGHCPFGPQNITISNFLINVPDLAHSSVISLFANGEYEVTLQVEDPTAGTDLGCVKFHAGLNGGGGGGFLFG